MCISICKRVRHARTGVVSLLLFAAAAVYAGAQGSGESGALPGMPPVMDPNDLYAAGRPGNLSPAVKQALSRVYVPNTESDSVSVIDPATYKVIDTIPVERQPQHVTPSWDLKKLWVLNDLANSLTEIDPTTGKKGKTIPVDDPYN